MRALFLALLLLPNFAFAETFFEYSVDINRPDARDTNPATTSGMYAPSLVTAQDGEVFIYINAGKEQIAGPSQPNCDSPIDTADCYSLTEWVNRSMDGLLTYIEFRKYVQSAIENWIGTEPVIEEALSLPMLGEYNIAFYIEDLWDDYGCGSPQSGPVLINNPTLRIGCKFADDDTRAIDLFDEVLTPGNYSFNMGAEGAPNASQLPNGQVAEGSVRVTLTLNRVDMDVIFRQPDFPNLVTSGYYLHTAGKLRLSNVVLELEVYSIGGNLRNVPSSGYGIGVDLRRLYIAGDIDLDVDAFECTFNNWCDASVLDPAHPEFGDQLLFEQKTNETNKLVGDLLRYIEATMVYEAVRASGAVTTYLTALEVLDMQSLTHTIGSYPAPPIFEHPFGGQVTWDYGFFYRFDAALDDNISIFGGAGIDLQYNDDCNTQVPPGIRYPTLPVPEMKESTMRDGKTAMVGMGIHSNALNRVLDNLWSSGIFCINLNQKTIGDVMNTDSFGVFIPGLSQQYKDMPLMARLVPRYVSSTSNITDFDKSVDQPTITLNPASPTTEPFDMLLSMPHLEWEFFLDTGSGFIPLFGIETSVDVYLGLGWYKINPTSSYWVNHLDGSYCDTAAAPCRVLRVSGYIDSNINQIISYNLDSYTSNLNGAVSNLLGKIVSGYLEGWLEVVINTTYIAGMTVDPALPAATETSPLFRGTVVEPLDIDNDAVYETLGAYFTIADVYGAMDTMGTTAANPDGYADIVHPDLVMGLALAPPIRPNGIAPEVYWESENELIIASWDTDQFMYRIDGGLFHRSGSRIKAPELFYGEHTIEVWGISKEGYLSDEPCVIVFTSEVPAVSQINYSCGIATYGSLWVIILILLLQRIVVSYRYEE